MALRDLARMDDMLRAIATTKRLSDGVSERTFKPSDIEVLALERAIEIVSEASRHIPEDVKAMAPTVPWRQIAGIGNILRHDDQRVRLPILAAVLFNDFPMLERELLSLRSTLEAALPTPPGPAQP